MFTKIDENLFATFKSKYNWLSKDNKIEEYIDPEYYNRILKEYSFAGESDLVIFEKFLNANSSPKSVLELGCGSGRVTDTFINCCNKMNWLCQLDILDLSNRMLDYCKNKYTDNQMISYINSDTFSYLENCNKKYDIVYSLWSYSHSIHQILPKLGYEKGKEYIIKTLKKFIINNLNENGKIFIIHFDTKSDEQRILIDQWKKLYNMFSDTTKQSPSLLITEHVLKDLQVNGVIDYKIQHLVGDEIIYENENLALETFLNFHMESEFNDLAILPQVIEELKNYFACYQTKDGKIKIRPGCFVIQIEKR